MWGRMRTVATMLKSGGLVVNTPTDCGEADPVCVRTLIQFDGDMVTSVVEGRLGDREILERHFSGVHALLADLDRVRSQLLILVVTAILLAPAVWSVGVFFASADRGWKALAWALGIHGVSSGVIAAAVATARRWVLARVLGWGREEFGTLTRDRLFPDEATRLF